MPQAPITKRHFLGLMAAAPLGGLVGCGGSGNDASVRLVNASAGYASIDAYVDDTLKISGVEFGGTSGYKDISADTVDVSLTSHSSSTYLLTQSRSLSAGAEYTIVAYGWEGALKSAIFTDDTDAADSGKTTVTVLNTASDAGTLDVYLTAEDDALSSATPIASAVGAGSQSSAATVTAGTYRLRVTGNDEADDLRLDVSGVVLGSKAVVMLVLTPGPSGVLVHGLQLVEGGAVTALLNTQARVRVVGGVSGNGRVAIAAGSQSLITNAPSPTISSYALVDAGSVTFSGTAAGVALTSLTSTLTAGSDYTVLVYGDAASPSMVLINDDNRLPTTSTKLKLRLLNAMNGMDDYPLALTVDYAAVATDVAVGTVSTPKSLASSSAATVEVSSALSSTPLLSLTDTTLDAQGVYTVFMFGTGADASGALRKER